MKHKYSRALIVAVLTCSFSLGSVPASVGAWQLSRAIERIQMGYSGNSVSYASENDDVNVSVFDTDAAAVDDNDSDAASTVAYDQIGSKEDESLQHDLRAGGGSSNSNSFGNDVEAKKDNSSQDSDNGASSAEQDAAQIEGAEVLQQGDGDTAGNVLVADRDAVDALGGRDFVGQSTAAINGVTYILIGNEQQLRAIGSGKHVISGTVYQVEQEFKGALGIGKWEDISEVQVAYAGDADVTDGTLRDKEFHNSIIEHPLLGGKRTLYFTEGENGERDDALEGRVNTGLTYSIDANYLIFRDIDLSTNAADPGNTGWDPLMFSSTMLGAKSDTPDTPGSLWSCIGADGKSITDVTAVANPVISNVKVVQSGAKLDVSKNTGIGFFGTISNKLDGKNPFAASTKATVSNITLEKVTVENHATEVLVDQSLISGLLKGLGTVVGGLVSTLLEILTLGKIDLSGLIENLLNVRAADPSALATGSFAGRIVGDVEVSGCEVHEAKVSSVAQMNGGFAGYVQGDTQYASESLGKVVELLAHLLNVIPGLGLSDLITLLLDSNIIDAGALVPNGYLNPVISHCAVHNFAAGETIGSANNDYAGGFAGVMVGAIAQDCSVESANPYKVTARLYAGGFAGLMRNDVMKGALSEVGVELVRVAQPQSAAAGCVVRSGVTVTAASYAGGFAGAMANSYAVDAAVEGTVNVSATGHEEEHDGQLSIKALAGGFTGAATVGWVTDLGQGENKNSDLLTGVNGLLTGLLTSNPEAAQNLLSLVGVEES